MNLKRNLGLMTVLGAALLLGACSSSDDDPVPTPATAAVPAGASQDSAGLTSYLKQLTAFTAADADLLEPVDVSGFTPPTQAATELEEPKEI